MIIFDIDVLANHNYFKVYRQTKPGEPERKLMFAVLVDAVQTYQKFAFSTSTRGQRLFRETERWFWRDDCDGVFSFCNICDVLWIGSGAFPAGIGAMDNESEEARIASENCSTPQPGTSKPKADVFSAE